MVSNQQLYQPCIKSLRFVMTVICIDFMIILRLHANYFDANLTNPLQYQVMNCTDNEPCTLICDEEDSCTNSTINCPKYNQCDISCTGLWDPCEYLIINPPINESLFNLRIDGRRPLSGISLPIYPVDDYSPFTLFCGLTIGHCSQTTIICPKYAACLVECSEKWACEDVCCFYLIFN